MTCRTLTDLRALYRAVDLIYFDGTLPALTVRWSRRGPATGRKNNVYFGHYWADPPEITIHPVQAWPWVPGIFLQWTLFHEALHAIYGLAHSPEFRTAEQRFFYLAEAEAWQSQNWDRLLKADCPDLVDLRRGSR